MKKQRILGMPIICFIGVIIFCLVGIIIGPFKDFDISTNLTNKTELGTLLVWIPPLMNKILDNKNANLLIATGAVILIAGIL